MTKPHKQSPAKAHSRLIPELISALRASTAGERIAARKQLVAAAGSAVPYLIDGLSSTSDVVRFESAKALAEIRDPRTIKALVSVLGDPSPGVRWLAAEALGRQGGAAVSSLLEAIVGRSQDREFCESAHHALHDLAARRLDPSCDRETLVPILAALDSFDAAVRSPVAAARALKEIREHA